MAFVRDPAGVRRLLVRQASGLPYHAGDEARQKFGSLPTPGEYVGLTP